MRLVTIGDSITKGTFTDIGQPSPNSVASPNFSDILKEKLGFNELFNYGINGTSISRTTYQSPELAMSIRVKDTVDADVIVVAAGTNDYGTHVQLGTIEDKEDVSFYGALHVFYTFLKENRKDSKIFIVTPIKRQGDGKNEAGFTLDQYRKAIEEKAEEFGFPVIDGFGVAIDPKTEEGRKKHILDGLHPNVEAHKLYGEYLYEQIKNKISRFFNNILKFIIICITDVISY